MKVGRNDLCPCGSGKKFKKCHLGAPSSILLPTSPRRLSMRFSPDFIGRAKEKFEHQQHRQEEHVSKFGQVMPMAHVPKFHDKRLVAVGPAICKQREKSTFTNFIFDYGLGRLGDQWLEEQNQLPLSDTHPLFLSHWKANQFVNEQPLRPEGYVTVKPNGPLSFCESFYYDLYTVANNGHVDEELLQRLRSRDLFQGAAHELFVEATCLRAGLASSTKKTRPANMPNLLLFTRPRANTSLSRLRAGIDQESWGLAGFAKGYPIFDSAN
jgi:hypothetical protein